MDEEKESVDESVQIEAKDVAPEPEIDELLPPSLEPEVKPVVKPPHPLHPGGVRFEQIYAKGKNLERELAEERKLRLAAEARLTQPAARPAAQETPSGNPEYTWAQLEQFIAQGSITRADANAHREEIVIRKAREQAEAEFTKKATSSSRNIALSQTIDKYIAAVPAILNEASAERLRLDEEFEWLASVQGVDTSKIGETERKALQATALRTIYGPIDTLTRKAAPLIETQQETPGGTPPKKKANPDQDIINGLTPRQAAFYTAQMKKGLYPKGWKDVVEELKFVPKR